jgi:hypothetical protein
MPNRKLPPVFLVAFSFAGEQRELLRDISMALEKKLGEGTIFFDEWFEYYIAGEDADLKLQEIYSQRCELAIVCVSERYGGKPWTHAEYAAIRARQMKLWESANERDKLRILPLRVGDGEVKGITENIICPDVRQKSIEQTAELILNRLRLIVPDAGFRSEAQEATRWIYLAESTADMDDPRNRMKAFLEDLGWTVLPTKPYPEDEYRARLEADLHQCRAFVQLLGPYPWKRGGFDLIQSDVAAALSIDCYRYRSSDIDLAKVESSHRDFLTAPGVIAAGFEDFKQYLEKKLAVLAQRPDHPPAADIPPRILVALRCGDPDAIWEKVFQWLYEQEHMNYCELRADESFASKFQAEPCHGFLVVCDATALQDNDRSPRELLEQCRQIQLRQKDANRRPPVGLVYWPPPPAKWALLLRSMPLKLHRILGDQPVNLEEFFSEVRKITT